MFSKQFFSLIYLGIFSSLIGFCLTQSACSSLNFVTRAQWKAAPSNLTTMKTKPVHHVFIHHTESPSYCADASDCAAKVLSVQKFHQETRGWDDIGYSFLVGGDGNVYEGRGWDKVGAHTRGMNDQSIAISLIGNFMTVAPPDLMLNVTKGLIACGKEKGYVSDDAQIHGHRDQNCTDCPGDVLYAIIKTWAHFVGGNLTTFIC